jgi:hypothetical protein
LSVRINFYIVRIPSFFGNENGNPGPLKGPVFSNVYDQGIMRISEVASRHCDSRKVKMPFVD